MKKISKRKTIPVVQNGFVRLTQRQYEELQKQIRNDVIAELSEDAIARVLLISGHVIWNHWGKLIRKKTRMKIFSELYKEYLEKLLDPTPAMLEAEAAFREQTDYEFIKE